MKEKQALIDFGLSEGEADTYLALFRLGGATAAGVAKEVGFQRTTVYPILKSLAKKGCILQYYRKNQQYYYAQKPDKLMGLFQKKLDFFSSVIPIFESMEKKQAKAIGLRFIETKEELRKFYTDILDDHKTYLVIGNAHVWQSIDPEFFEEYRQTRAKLGIKTRLLLSADSEQSNPDKKDLLRNFRYLPPQFTFKSTINIFNDKILIVSSDSTSLAVVISIPAMVDVFKSIFEIIWSYSE
jgi:sugar-specific transcriptional regulator TrmB